MYARVVLLVGGIAAAAAAFPAEGGEMKADEARRFVIGKTFAYNCFEGTAGTGRIQPDGSVTGSIRISGAGPVHHAVLPAGTLQVKGDQVCASVRGLPIEPCFDLQKTDNQSFRGSISGLSFAYCDFTQHRGRVRFGHTASRRPTSQSAVVTASEQE